MNPVNLNNQPYKTGQSFLYQTDVLKGDFVKLASVV